MLVELEAIVPPLMTALGLSLVVERVVEFITNVFGYFPINEKIPVQIDINAKNKKLGELNSIAAAGIYSAEQEDKAEKIAADLDKTGLDKNDPAVSKLKQDLAQFQRDREWNEAVPANIIAWQAATPPSGERVYREITLHAVGLALGITLAAFSDLKLFSVFISYAGGQQIPNWLDYLFTGLLISAGSGPIHVLIRFISERKFVAKPEELKSGEGEAEVKTKSEPALKLAPGAVSPAREQAFKEADWIPISYKGGVDADRLETVHRRKQNPNCVIYHHTAMRRDSTFEDVVRVIKSRKDSKGNSWLTGYNCVITEDGGIHPFCRWDRYGSHAAGYNSRSLGIAFNGNFETSRSDSYSNFDGRYGPPVPTQPQLEAGARVVALWAHIYKDIETTFDVNGCIFPHRQVAAKNCPGREFPQQDFYELVNYYYNKWQGSPVAMAEIGKFMRKPYLYI